MNCYSLKRINCYVRENLYARKYHQRLAARKFCCAKISTFTLVKINVVNLLLSNVSMAVHCYIKNILDILIYV